MPRIAYRSQLLNPILEEDQWSATAYLISITPSLQVSTASTRQQLEAEQAAAPSAGDLVPLVTFDAAETKEVFENTSSLCHETTDVDGAPPQSVAEAKEPIERMVENGLLAPDEDLRLILAHLDRSPRGDVSVCSAS